MWTQEKEAYRNNPKRFTVFLVRRMCLFFHFIKFLRLCLVRIFDYKFYLYN